MAEHYEIQAATGYLTVSCACEKNVIFMSVEDVRRGWAGACKEGRCRTLAAQMNGVDDGGDSPEVAVSKMWGDLRLFSPRKRRHL